LRKGEAANYVNCQQHRRQLRRMLIKADELLSKNKALTEQQAEEQDTK
jgi:hypothetical protein